MMSILLKRISWATIILIPLLAGAQETNKEVFDSLGLLAPGAALQKVSDQFSFTEGPAVDKNGSIFFTDQPNDHIWKYGTDGKLSLFMENTGRSNGLYFDHKGNLLSCADLRDELWSISPDKKVTVLLTGFNGKRLNGPNDLWVDPNGGIYLTDPYYQRDWWDRKSPDIKGQYVYYLPPGKNNLILVDTSLKQPNGIIGTPDGKTLYVADIGAWKTYQFSIQPDGTLADRKLFINQGSDGMTIDQKGNLYLTGNGVSIYNREGIRIGQIPVPAKWTANVCFGGKDRQTLFITASEAVYTIRTNVPGAR